MGKEKDLRRFLRLRLKLIGFTAAAVCLLLLGRAVDLMVIKGERLAAIAERGIYGRIIIPPRRGIIYDRNQEELAVSLDVDSVYAAPVKVIKPRRTSRLLARALELDRNQQKKVETRLAGEKGFAWVSRRVPPDKARAVEMLKLEGVGLVKEPKRFYPYTFLACHVIGFAGLDAKGHWGLEQGYDQELRGPKRTVVTVKDGLRRTISLDAEAFAELNEGRHLILTLDKRLQYHTEAILAKAVSSHKAKAGQAIVMDVRTGEILAMASVPAFNPNVAGNYSNDAFRNRNVTDQFEPGSTFKVFVAAAALKSGKVGLEQFFDCEKGEWKIGGRVIHDTHEYENLNLADIIKFSSNIGAAKVGQTVGANSLYRTLKDFGFGQPTGVDLPGESRGSLRPPERWRPVELANICFGQGVSVTTLQMVNAFASVANGGLLMRPFVVKAQVDQNGNLVNETRPRVVRRVMSPSENRILTRMLVRVTEPGGTGARIKLPPFTLAGKTGTAQKVMPKGGYSKTDYMSSFVGFLPADDPKVAILVVVDTPYGRHYGGTVAGPAWAGIAKAALETLEIHSPAPPTQLVRTGPALAPPSAPKADPSVLLARGLTPDLSGFTLRQILRLEAEKGLKVKARGWGRVIKQKPAAGKPLGKRLEVLLAPPGGEA